MAVVAPFRFDFTGLAAHPVLLSWFRNCDAMNSTMETVAKSDSWSNSKARQVLQIKTETLGSSAADVLLARDS